MAFIDPYDKEQPESVETGSGEFIDPYDEVEGKGRKPIKKGSFKDQLHDVASAGTAAVDLITSLPGMVGGPLGNLVGQIVHGKGGQRGGIASELLQSVGEGAETSSFSNWSGITEKDPEYRERPGYKAVMKPVELVSQAMHAAGVGVEKAAESGWLGTDRANTKTAKELGAGTELGLMAALPFLRTPAAKPGSARAFREATEAPKQGTRSFNEARDTYFEEPTKPFDIKDFKDPYPEGFEPEFRPSQFEGPDDVLMSEATSQRNKPAFDPQDTFGLAPETTVQRQAMELNREQRGQVPIDDLTGRGAREEVLPQPPGPIEYDAAGARQIRGMAEQGVDPVRAEQLLGAQEVPGFLRSAEEVMRARELERMENPRVRSDLGAGPSEKREDFIKALKDKGLYDEFVREQSSIWDAHDKGHLSNEKFVERVIALEERYFEKATGTRSLWRARHDKNGPKDARLSDVNALEFWNDDLSYILARGFEETGGGRTNSLGVWEPNKAHPVREGLELIQRSSKAPYYRELAKKLLEDPEFKPDFSIEPKGSEGLRLASGRNAPGRYTLSDHKIRIQEGLQGSEQLFLHEALHARTAAAVQVFKDTGVLPPRMRHLEVPIKRIFELYDSLKSMSRLNDKYGLKDQHEFIAEGFANPAFQAELAQIKLPKELQTKGLKFYWDAFVSSVADMFGFKGKDQTYLSELLRAGSNLMTGMGSAERIHYANLLDPQKDLGGPTLKEFQRKGAVKTLQEEAREMSLEGRHNTPIEKVVEKVAGNRLEDFTAEYGNMLWQATARAGSLVKENLLIDTSIRQLMKDKMGSGPLIKWAIDSVSFIERESTRATKMAIDQGLSDLRRMYHAGDKARSELVEMWKTWQENIGVRDLTRADFRTERQWNIYSKMRAVDDMLLDKVNAMRATVRDAEGNILKPIARIPSHFRGLWEGDYRVFAYDGAGNKKAAFGFETEWGARKAAEEFRKKHPDLTVKFDHVKTDQYGIGNLSAFEDAIKVMSEKNDPIARALQETYKEILQRRGFGRTAVHRKGIAGYLGSEGGLMGLRNMERAFEQHVNQAHRYLANLEKQKVLADLQSVPKEIWDKMPHTKGFLEDYIRKTQGKVLRDNGWVDSALTGLSRAIGFGEHGPQKAVRGLSTVATLWWLTTPRFLLSQGVQSLNAVPKLVQKFGQIDAAKAYFTGLHRAIDKSARDATANEAIAWAKERGYLDATIHNLMEKGLSGRPIGSFADAAKEVLSWPAQGIERKLVRTPVFLAFEDALRPYVKDKAARFEEAAEYADYYMVNYGGSHAPMAYNKMGLTGEMAKPLKQYAHNTWGQFFEYSRNLKNKGEVAPLAYFLGVQASVAGLKGMMIVAEVTAIVTFLNYVFNLDIPTPEQLMLRGSSKAKEYGVPGGLLDAMVYGGLSYALQTDISASVSAPGIPNMFSVPPVQFTYGLVRDLGNYVWKKAKGEDTDQDRLKALLAITPNAFHEWVKSLYKEEGQPTPNPYDKNLRGNYRRSETEDFMSKYITAAKPLDEAKADALMRAVKQDIQRDLKQKTDALDAIVDRIQNGQGIDERLMLKFIEQGGSPANLPQQIRNKIKERMMTGPERVRDMKNITPSNAHKLEVLEDYINQIDESLKDKHGSYKWDPNTGDIVPVGFGSEQPVGLEGKRVYNDTEPPPGFSWMPEANMNIDPRMKHGSKERSASEYRTPQIDPMEFYKRKAREKGKKPTVRM